MSLPTLNLIGNVCGAIGMFGLGLKTQDRWGRMSCFVLSAASAVVVVASLLP